MIHARNLSNLNPYVVVSLKGSNNSKSKRKLLGQTEIIRKNCNPSWAKVFTLPYEFHESTFIQIDLYEENDKIFTGENELLGSTTFEIGDILGKRVCTQEKQIENENGFGYRGSLSACVCKASDNNLGKLYLILRWRELKRLGGGRRSGGGLPSSSLEKKNVSSPFFELGSKKGGGEWRTILRSPPSTKDRNSEFKWDVLSVNIDHLCGGDWYKKFKISVFDKDDESSSNGNGIWHAFIGSFEISCLQLMKAKGEKRVFELKDKNFKPSGNIYVTSAWMDYDMPQSSTREVPQQRSAYFTRNEIKPVPEMNVDDVDDTLGHNTWKEKEELSKLTTIIKNSIKQQAYNQLESNTKPVLYQSDDTISVITVDESFISIEPIENIDNSATTTTDQKKKVSDSTTSKSTDPPTPSTIDSSRKKMTSVNIMFKPEYKPGMKLCFQNPKTGQTMMIFVPEGVSAGESFIVQCP